MSDRTDEPIMWHDCIITDWAAACDHLLWECPAVRLRRSFATLAVDKVDPRGTHICGWCQRVYMARAAKVHSGSTPEDGEQP